MTAFTDEVSGTFGDRFTIEAELGRGATAIVYRSRDSVADRIVALKILRHELVQSLGSARFLREIEHQRRLSHPRILPVLDSGDVEGRLYLVLPYMEGGTLRDRLQRQKQLPYADAVRIAASIARGLAHAHAAGLVHRDVKPENILFSGKEVYLGDFGIARALETAAGASSTSTGIVRGTPAYMSPEQAAGQTEFDGRSDIYSLGCVLYEMVTGMPAFVGPTQQSIITQRLSFRPTALSQFRENVPASLDEAIAKSMALTPADRYQDAGEFADALDRVAEDLKASRYRTVETTRHRQRRRMATVASMGIIGALSGLLYFNNSGEADPAGIPPGDPRRVAVLYLDALTPDVLPAYVADGITEDLIDRLGSVTALHVTPPNAVRSYRAASPPIARIRSDLQVGTLVSGSLARSGNILRLTVRMIDASSERVLDSQVLEEAWTDLFSLQDKLAEQIEFWLRERLGDAIALRMRRSQTKSIAAWEEAQMASAAMRRAVETAITRNDTNETRLFLRADSAYVRASRLDPGWNHPIVQRGELALLALAPRMITPPDVADRAAYGGLSPQQRRVFWIRRALQLANLALQRAPDDAEALALRGHGTYALLLAGEPGRDTLRSASERDLQAAVAARPNLARAWSALAELAVEQGHFADGAEAARRAIEADAFLELRRALAVGFTAALHAELLDDARGWCRMGLTRYPSDPRFTECELRLLGWTGHTRADAAEAWRLIAAIEKADTIGMLGVTWSFRRFMAAAILARVGLNDSARRVVGRIRNEESEGARRASALAESYVLVLLGERNQALARLEEHVNQAPELRGPLALHPWFRPLRSEARFVALTRPPG